MPTTKTRYPNVYRDSKGQYFYQIFLGRDANGKKKTKKGRKDATGRSFSSAKMCYEESLRVKQEYSNIDINAMNYSTFMRKKFMPKYRGDVEESTYSTHVRMFAIAIEHLGELDLKKIKVEDCERFRTWLLTDSGFSQGYCNAVYTAFRQSLGYAEHLGLILKNVSMATKPIPKGKKVESYWTLDQFQKVISCIATNSFYEQLIYVTFLLYFRTGMRLSEGLSLTWPDVDLNNGLIRVFHTMDYHNQQDYTIKPYTKTEAGKRTINIDDELVEVLKNWRQMQLKNGVKNFVLSYTDTPLVKSTISRWIKKYSELAGVPKINAKGLRHSHASFLIAELGADVLTVSRRMGHSNPAVTLKYYAHFFPDNDEFIADKMAGTLDLTPAENSHFHFNGNQNLSGMRLDGLPKVCQKKKKSK